MSDSPRRMAWPWLTAAMLAGGCQPGPKVAALSDAATVAPAQPNWQSVATPDDRDRLARLDAAWTRALDTARKAGFVKQIASEGGLLESAAALPRAAPAPGSYTCRMIRLGRADDRDAAYTAFKPFFCHVGVSEDRLSITKQTGSQRPGGYLWETGDSARLIFLGAVALADEEMPLAYGVDATRDVAGVFERHDDFRYRLVMPFPRHGAALDVLELIAAPAQP